jgi:hypothetical protein
MSTQPNAIQDALEPTRADLWALWRKVGAPTLSALRALERQHGRVLDRVALQPWEMCARNGASPDTILQMQDLRRQLQHDLQMAITDLWEIPDLIRGLTTDIECDELSIKGSGTIRVTIQDLADAPARFMSGIRALSELLVQIQAKPATVLPEVPSRVQ